jgi:hypothetical protein
LIASASWTAIRRCWRRSVVREDEGRRCGD